MRTIGIISASLVVLAVGLWVFRHGREFKWQVRWRSLAQGLAGAPGPEDVGPVVRLDPFLVTEWEGDRQRYVTVTFELEVDDDQGRQAVTARTSKIRSEILALLADLRLSDMGDATEYEALKTQVQKRIQPLAPMHPIRRVLITEFLIE